MSGRTDFLLHLNAWPGQALKKDSEKKDSEFFATAFIILSAQLVALT